MFPYIPGRKEKEKRKKKIKIREGAAPLVKWACYI
jgi:hypothetical protein